MADDPSMPTLFGWDASDYDWQRGPMDLAAAARDGISFFTHKATEGGSTRHRYYGEALRRARDAGIPVLGAYHVVRSSPSPQAQADFFLSYLDSQTPWWREWPCFFLQVDLEKWPYDAVPASAGEAFADIAGRAAGRPAVIYASRGQYGDQLNGTSHELWNANYGSNIEDHFRDVYAARGADSGAGWAAYSGRVPMFWQYGSRTTIGTQTICDANAFRGTLPELIARLNGDQLMLTNEERDHLLQLAGRNLALVQGTDTVEWKDAPIPGEEVWIVKEVKAIGAKLDGLTVPEIDYDKLAAALVKAGAATKADVRDAVADLGEGGAAAVRADADGSAS